MPLRLDLTDRTIDLDTGRISTGGELRPMELKLLRYLLQRAGEVVSHEELLADVWGYASSARTRTIYSTLHRLRAALENDPKSPRYLLTVAGEGVSLSGLPRAAPARPTNLSPSGARLLGRRSELAWLQQSQARLVTITGPGGVGKTRLALEYAAEELQRGTFQQVWFCGIEDLGSIEDVAQRITQVIGLETTHIGRDRIRWELANALASCGAALVILDGIDLVAHALGEVISSWIERAPLVRFVLTSREPLRVGLEQRKPLDPLPQDDARELLIERIQSVDPSFGAGSPQESEPLVDLIRMLDGLPLAIEIVAPHIAALGFQAVQETLTSFGSLPNIRRDVPDRHRSLSSVVAWSIDRLPPESRTLLSQLTAFPRWFSTQTAGEVAALPPGKSLIEMIADLIERGLVYRVPGARQPRFALYATVKAHLGPPDREVLERYVRGTAARIEAWYATCGGLTPDDPDPTDDVDDLVRAAELSHLCPDIHTDALVDLALRCSTRAGRDALALAERLLERCSERTRARILAWIAPRLVNTGRAGEGFALWRSVADLASREGLHQVACASEQNRASQLFNHGELAEASNAIASAERLLREIRDPLLRARLEGEHDDLRSATLRSPREAIEKVRSAIRSLALARSKRQLAVSRHNAASKLTIWGEHEEAEQQMLAALQELPAWARAARVNALCQLCETRLAGSDLERAAEALDEAEAYAKRHFLELVRARVLIDRSRIAEARGELLEASDYAEQSIALAARYRQQRVALMAKTSVIRLARRRKVLSPYDPETLVGTLLAQQMWHAATQILLCKISERADGIAGDSPLPLAERLVRSAEFAASAPWLIRIELLRDSGRAIEGIYGLQDLAAAHLPARAERILLARASALAEHGDPRDAIALASAAPRLRHAWARVYRSRACRAAGIPDDAPPIEPHEIDPLDVYLARAAQERNTVTPQAYPLREER